MKKHLIAFCVLLVFVISIGVEALAYNQGGTAVITGGNADRVHLREQPSKEADSLGLYFAGTPVIYTGNLNETWVLVQIGSEQGYMMSAFLSDRLEETYPLNEKRAGTVYTSSWVSLRVSPSIQAQELMQLQDGDQVQILGETNTHWYYVSCNGFVGYVKVENIVHESQRYVHDHITPNVIEVMTGENSFWHTGAGKGMYIYHIGDQCFDRLNVTFPRFAIADVDQDTNDEIVLAMTVGDDEYYGYLVLKSADSTVWGYEIYYRSMLSLKTDGTFSFSSGAADNGFGYLNPEGDLIYLVKLAESVSDDESVSYFLNGKKVSESLYRDAITMQDQKPDAIWYDLTDENMMSVMNEIMSK